MTHAVGPSWWRPYETASQQYTCGLDATAEAPGQRLATAEPQEPPRDNQLDACQSSGPLDMPVILEHGNGDPGDITPGGTASFALHPHQYNNDGRQRSASAYIPLEQSPGSPLSFRQALDNQQHLFEVPTPCNSVRQSVQTTDAARRNQRFFQHKASPHPHRETPCRLAPLKCTPDAVSGPQCRYAQRNGNESKTDPGNRTLAMNEDASDRLSQVEKILDQLIHEAKILRTENMELRAARKDLRNVSGMSQQADGAGGGECVARLKCEVDMLRRRLREQDEKLRCLRHESAYMDACREPSELRNRPSRSLTQLLRYLQLTRLGSKLVLSLEDDAEGGEDSGDEKLLRARLLFKEDALRKSEQEISALRSELAMLKCSDESRKSELERLRTYCRELKCQLLEKQQEVRSCASETVSLGAKAAAAKGAQLNKAWELEQMERRFQSQLSQQVEGRLSIEAGKQEAEREVERLREAFRSAKERVFCQAEQLQDRDEEVQLLQQRVDRLCRKGERDTAKLKEQGAAMLRWRAYVRFLEKVIRDLRMYIVSQGAAPSVGGLPAAPDARSHSSAVPSGISSGGVSDPLQQEGRTPMDFSKERHSLRRQPVETEISNSLAAMGYSLLPFPFSPYEPSLHQPLSNSPPTLSKAPHLQPGPQRERVRFGSTAPQNEESASVEQLGRLMQEAAQELRATAAAARRGQGSTCLRTRRPCCSSPVLGGVSSPGSTEASSISGIGDSISYSPAEHDPAGRRPPNECLEHLQGRDFVPPPAYAIFSERSLATERAYLAYPEESSLTDAGSLSDFSGLMGASRRKRGSCMRRLSKGAAAAHLAKEISIRFPTAFDRLKKTTPSCKLVNRM